MNKPKPTIASPDQTEQLDDESYRLFANGIILLGIILVIIGLANWPVAPKGAAETTSSYWTRLGTIGDFTAGVGGTCFALGGFIYLYLSFKKQRESNEVQRLAFQHDKVETRFFELIKLHRDNVNELTLTHHTRKFSGYDKEGQPTYLTEAHDNTQRQVFHHIVKDFEDAFKELQFLFDGLAPAELYETGYLDQLQANKTLFERKIAPLLLGRIDLIYLIVFFGAGSDGKKTIKSLVHNKYREAFVDQLLAVAALKPVVTSLYWPRWLVLDHIPDGNHHKILLAASHNETIDFTKLKNKWPGESARPYKNEYTRKYVKYYGGHQFRLGHYFRHMFQSVTFVNDQEELYAEDQYSYVKHLRGQLSTYEQILVFINSLSQLGRIWELEDRKTGMAVSREKQLFTDYQIIKNIPHNEIIPGIKLSDFYPGIVYEGFDASAQAVLIPPGKPAG
ncbi:MAG: hypothetical protein JWQ66_3233 [Mucilaginibacter sp.]|nr:hypothetical protein [Mucilaginibacter sp.]